MGIVRRTTVFSRACRKTGCPILRASCEGWVIERSETVFRVRKQLPQPIEANPMITIDPPSSFGTSLSTPTLTRFLNRARTAVGVRGAVDVLLSDDPTLRDLNKNFRGNNKPTDVLSFPAPSTFAAKHAGDLAISLETAARQATTYGHILRDEVRILILHGLLHLTGEDHETDNGEMATREAALRSELRLPATLIERTAAPGSKQPSRTTKKTSAATKTTSKTAKTAAKKIQSRAATGRPSTARSKRGGK